MSSSPSVLTEFRMSAFVALISLRRYVRDHAGTPANEAALSLKRSDADLSALDFDGALRLHDFLPPDIDFADAAASLRRALFNLIDVYRPWWCSSLPYGRQRLALALTQDELQTLRSADLLSENPSSDVVEWWDALAAKIRASEDEKRSAQGREGERLSMEYERSRLLSLGLSAQPKWTALEDNSAGYDIQSFELTAFGTKNRLIEVKTSKQNPPRIVLTRGEWIAAQKYGEAYIFHLWELPSKNLTTFTAAEIAEHIPTNNGNGTWTEVEIRPTLPVAPPLAPDL